MLKFLVFLALMLVSSEAFHSRERRRSPEGCKPSFPKECVHTKLDISFVVDASSSISLVNFKRCLSFIEDFVSNFLIGPENVKVSFVTFAKEADEKNAFGFNEHTTKNGLKEAIARTNYTKYLWTNTSAGLWYMLQHHQPEARGGNVRHVVIVITDGRSQETSLTKRAALDVFNAGVEVFAIGVGPDVYYPELVTLARDGRHVLEAESYEVLHTINRRLLFESCDVPTIPECEMDPVEMAFVMDSSSSIGEDNFTLGMDFISTFVEEFKVDQKHVRVALITFDLDKNEEDAIHFDDYSDYNGVVEKLKKIGYHAGAYTNTSAGIQFMREVLMKSARPGAARICIVITDGKSQEWQRTIDEAQSARDAGIVMYAVGVGKDVDSTELENIAGTPARSFKAVNYAQLNVRKGDLLNITCSGILESIRSQGSAQLALYPPAEA